MKTLLTTLALFFVTSYSYAEDPSEFLENVANNMVAQVETNKKALKTDTALAEKLVRDTLLPAIDTNVFARKTLTSSKWKTLSDQQKQRFTDGFIKLVVGNYASGLALYDGQAFKFSKAILSKTGKLAKVRSSMEQESGTPIIIDYVLSVKTGSWKIIDLTIEGVNMSKSYKSQFLPRIQSMGMDEFLTEMESKSVKALKEVAEKS